MASYIKHKLHIKSQYDNVFANRKVIKTKYYKFFWCDNDLGYPRLGVSVAKRNIAKAVSRNKIKRLIKEQFRINCNSIPAIDIVFIVKKETLDVSKEIFVSELSNAWNQINIQKKHVAFKKNLASN